VKQKQVLIVEDSQTQALKLTYILEEQRYEVKAAGNGREALAQLNSREFDPEIIISDVVMPEMDGYELCQKVKANERLKKIPIVLLTSLSDPESVIKGLASGADHFVVKPYDPAYLLLRVQQILEEDRGEEGRGGPAGVEVSFGGEKYHIAAERRQILNFMLSAYEVAVEKNRELNAAQGELKALNERLEQKVEERTEALKEEILVRRRAEEALKESFGKLEKTLECTVNTLSVTTEKRDSYTSGHQKRVAQIAIAIAGEMGMSKDQIQGLHMAGLLHDIGKVAVPLEILSKPGMIGYFEMGIIKMHPQVGYDILKDIQFPWPVAEIVRQHQERFDGSGYPQGLKNREILLEARILAVADVVEAMSSHRPYRPSLGMAVAGEEISKNRSIHYDPEVVDACLRVIKAGHI
jgi:putative nucleotidyltransferase with HDIG domain